MASTGLRLLLRLRLRLLLACKKIVFLLLQTPFFGEKSFFFGAVVGTKRHSARKTCLNLRYLKLDSQP
jgi:hypothetical protein